METTIEHNKFHCNMCNYVCLYESHWQQHLESNKHNNNGQRLPRCDKILEPKCKHCDYTSKNNTNMKLHYLNHHSNKEERKHGFKYYCDECDVGNFTKSLFKLHMESKHS
jgi:hypothetical protein